MLSLLYCLILILNANIIFQQSTFRRFPRQGHCWKVSTLAMWLGGQGLLWFKPMDSRPCSNSFMRVSCLFDTIGKWIENRFFEYLPYYISFMATTRHGPFMRGFHRWPLDSQKASDTKLFFAVALTQNVEQTVDFSVIRDATTHMWHHCNAKIIAWLHTW